MTLTTASGNMYKEIDHLWSPICGCQHSCTYCYLIRGRFRYNMNPKIRQQYLLDNLYWNAKSSRIFVGNCGDMWGKWVPREWITQVLDVCREYPLNIYLFQTKNPERFLDFLPQLRKLRCILATTIETNFEGDFYAAISKAPGVGERVGALAYIHGFRKQVTVEPVIQFYAPALARLIRIAGPDICYIGADSKSCGLTEPHPDDIIELAESILLMDTEVILKDNLRRILGGQFDSLQKAIETSKL